MIEIKNLHVKLGSFLLQEISLKLESGKFHILFGESGSGKTKLLETIAGLIKPEKGEVLLHNENATYFPPEKRNISYVPQDIALFPHLNVNDNIRFGLNFRCF
ncbi:MAG: ATP-binding cassette domain-containing protein, partial [Cytophagaceae bacterium]